MRVLSSQMLPPDSVEQAGQAVERRRFAAAGRSQQGDEFAAADRQIDALERVDDAEIAAHPVEPQLAEITCGYSHSLVAPVLTRAR